MICMRGVGLCLFTAFLAGCSSSTNSRLSVSGQIQAVSVDAGSRVGGRVTEVLAREGAPVKQGDVLVRLEQNETKAVYDAACAKQAQARALLDKLKAGPRPEEFRRQEATLDQAEAQYLMAVRGARSEEINRARSQCEAAKARRDQIKGDYERARNLAARGAISQQKADQAKFTYEAAEKEYQAMLDQLDLLLHGTRDEQISMAKSDVDKAKAVLDEMKNGARPEDIAAAQAACDAAAADKARAQAALDEMTVVAPRDGLVEKVELHPGDLVRPGPVLRIIDPENLEMYVYVSAKYLGLLRLNQTVTLTADSYGNQEFKGSITYLSPEGEYTPRNLQTEEERARQVFAVKLKLDSAGGKLRAGMTATAHFDFSGSA